MGLRTSDLTPVTPSTNGLRLTPSVFSRPVLSTGGGPFSSIELVPYTHDRIALYNGTRWEVLKLTTAGYSLVDRTPDLPFDIFAKKNAAGDPNGAVSIEILNWQDTGGRLIDIAPQDGVWVKQSDHTRRYLGTCRPKTATQYDFRLFADDVFGGRVDLWNVENQVPHTVGIRFRSDVASWDYTSAAWRVARGDAPTLELLYGGKFSNSPEGRPLEMHLAVSSSNSNTTPVARAAGLEVGSTIGTGNASDPAMQIVSTGGGVIVNHSAHVSWPIFTPGAHQVRWMEWSEAVGTTTWINHHTGTGAWSGARGTWWC